MQSTLDINWLRIDPQRFEHLCGDIARETLGPVHRLGFQAESMPQQADFQRDGTLEACRFERLAPPVLFSFKTSDPQGSAAAASKSITAEFLKGLPRLLTHRPKSIVLWANHDFRPRDKLRIEKAMPRGVGVLVEGRSQLEERLIVHPHLLTKYFGWSEFVQCFHSTNHDDLRAALAGASGGALALAVPRAGVPHTIETNGASGRRLRLLGGPGSGKSFCLFRMVTALDHAEIILLRSLDRALVWEHLSRVVHHTQRPVVVVIDNLHEFLHEGGATDVLGPLLESRETRDRAATVLVSHWTAKRPVVERAIPATQWARWGFEDISIDNPPRGFIDGVVAAACTQLEIDADESMRQAFVTEIREWENTPACAVASLLPYRGTSIKGEHGFHPVSLKERDATWRRLFLDLCNKGTKAEAIVLRAMSALRWSGNRGCVLETVKEVAVQVGGSTSQEVDDAIETLEQSGWVQRDGQTLRSHDLQILPTTVGLHDSGRPSIFLERFTKAVSDDTLVAIKNERPNVLHHLGEMYWHMGLWEYCAQFNTLILAEDRQDIRAICNRAACYLKLNRADEAITDLRTAVEVDPEAIGPPRLLYNALRRHGRDEEALAVLNRVKERKPADARAWAFLAQAYSQLRKKREAIQSSRHLTREHPDDPEAKALLAQTLWLANRREDARRLLDRSLRRWPEAGSLLHVRADIEEQTNSPACAVPFAERALRANPNNPAIHALAAWLNMAAGQMDRAYEIASVAADLFRGWPDLLAVWGLLLERRDRLDEADTALRRAYEQNDHVSDVYRPNLFLGLGRVSIRLQRPEDAERWFALAANAGVDRVFVCRTISEACRLAGDKAEARDALQQAASLRKTDPELWFELAILNSSLGDKQRAAGALDEALALAPDNAEFQFLRGVIFKDEGRVADAVAHFQTAVRLDPQKKDAWKELGLATSSLGDSSAAAAALEKALALGATDDTALLAYAWTLRGLERTQEAITHCRTILSRSPDDRRAHAIEARCQLDAGHRARAIRALKFALAGECDDEELWPMLVRIALEAEIGSDAFVAFRRGIARGWRAKSLGCDALIALLGVAVKAGCDPDIMTVLRCIHETYGPDPTNLLNMARCAKNLQQPDAALAYYAELLEHAPLHFHVVQERAKLLIRLGRTGGLFETASELYARLPEWLREMNVALAHLANGDRDACVTHFVGAVGLVPDPPDLSGVDAHSLVSLAKAMGVRDEVAALLTGKLKESALNAAELHFTGWLLDNPALLGDALALEPTRVNLAADIALQQALSGNACEACRLARTGLLLNQQTTQSLSKLGRALLLGGAPAEEVLRVAEEALTAAGHAGDPAWAANHLKAEGLNGLGRWQEALEVGEESLREEPTALGYTAVVRSLTALGRKQEALDRAEDGCKRFPDDIELKVGKALLLNLLGKDKDCVALVRSMGAVAAVMATPLLDMADCLLRARRFVEAAKAYNAARRNLEPVREKLQHFHVRATAGEVDALVGQRKQRQAVKLLESLGDAYLIESGLWQIKVNVCGQMGDDSEVLRLADMRIVGHPDDLTAHWYRAVALSQLRQYQNALDTLERSTLLVAAASSAAWNLKAQILLQLHRPEEAIDAVYEGCELRHRQENRADLSAVGTVLAALPKCATPPTKGLQLGTALLGAYCGTHRDTRAAKQVLKCLRNVGWETRSYPKTGHLCVSYNAA